MSLMAKSLRNIADVAKMPSENGLKTHVWSVLIHALLI